MELALSDVRGQSLDLKGIGHVFGATVALDEIHLAVAAGELIALLGPSGCGKTTMLQIIAGFLRPSRGEVRFDGARVEHIPANRRRIGMVFQNYALFPHLTVFENVAYGLRARKRAEGFFKLRQRGTVDADRGRRARSLRDAVGRVSSAHLRPARALSGRESHSQRACSARPPRLGRDTCRHRGAFSRGRPRRAGLGRAYGRHEGADLLLQARAVGRQRTGRRQDLRRRRTGLGRAALHVGHAGGDLLRTVCRLLNVA